MRIPQKIYLGLNFVELEFEWESIEPVVLADIFGEDGIVLEEQFALSNLGGSSPDCRRRCSNLARKNCNSIFYRLGEYSHFVTVAALVCVQFLACNIRVKTETL